MIPPAHPSRARAAPEYPAQNAAGDWQIRRGADGLSMYRRMNDSVWVEAPLGTGGFEHDAVRAIEMAGDRLVALTDAGLVDFSGSKEISPAALHRVARGGRLTRQGNTTTYLVPTGALEFQGSGKWLPGQAPTGTGPNGIRWAMQPTVDVLDPTQFDAQRGRFNSDISIRLVRDPQSRVWVETRAGWRRVEVVNRQASLPLVSESPTPAPDDRNWDVNDTWRVRVISSDEADRVTFTFANSGEVSVDPFGARGRLPDDTALSVMADANAVWFGTEGGLRQAGAADLQLAGRRILAVARSGDRIWCRTPDGDFAGRGNNWERAAAPAGLFGGVRQLRLDLGPGLQAQAIERTEAGAVSTELVAWDAAGRRFLFDQVTDLDGDAGGLWLATPAGVGRLEIGGPGRIRSHSRPLAATGVEALRRDTGGLLVAGSASGAWRLESGKWKPLASGAPGNPFASALTGRFAPAVNWERHYSPGGDHWYLMAGGKQVAITDGKLAIDYILATAIGDPQVRVTRAGIVRDGEVAPLPSGNARIGVLADRLVARTETGVLEYREAGWRAGDSAALPSVVARFDGLRWRLAEEPAFRSKLLVRTDGEGWSVPTLDARGRFPFDAVDSVLALEHSVMIAHGDGVSLWNDAMEPVNSTAFPTGTGVRARLQADNRNCVWWYRDSGTGGRALCVGDSAFRQRTAEDLKTAAALAAPAWSGATTRASFIEPGVLRLERSGAFPTDLPIDGTGVAIAEQNGQLMLAATRAVYRLDLPLVPLRYMPASGRNAGLVLEKVYFGSGAQEPTRDELVKVKRATQTSCRAVRKSRRSAKTFRPAKTRSQ